MAGEIDVKGVEITAVDAVTAGTHATRVEPTTTTGVVRVINATCVLSTGAAGSLVYIARLPAGARLLSMSVWASAVLANSATISWGTRSTDLTVSLNADSIAAAAALAADVTPLVILEAAADLVCNIPAALEMDIVGTTGTGATASETVYAQIQYVID